MFQKCGGGDGGGGVGKEEGGGGEEGMAYVEMLQSWQNLYGRSMPRVQRWPSVHESPQCFLRIGVDPFCRRCC